MLVHGSLDRSTAFLRVARALQRPHACSATTGAATASRWPSGACADLRRPGRRPGVGRGRRARRSWSATASAAWSPSPSPAATRSWRRPSSPTRRRCRGCRGGRRTPRAAWRWPSPAAKRDAAERFMRRIVGDERWEQLPERTKDAAPRRGAGAGRRAPLAAPAAPGRRTTSPRSRCRWSPATAACRGRTTRRRRGRWPTQAPTGRAGRDRGRVARRPPHPPDGVRRPRQARGGARGDPRRELEVGIAERHRQTSWPAIWHSQVRGTRLERIAVHVDEHRHRRRSAPAGPCAVDRAP